MWIQDSYVLLTNQKEIDLLKHINSLKDVIADAAITRSPNKICNYAHKLASLFHSFYNDCKIIDKDNETLTNERLGLATATKIALKNSLNLLGVQAIEYMAKEED